MLASPTVRQFSGELWQPTGHRSWRSLGERSRRSAVGWRLPGAEQEPGTHRAAPPPSRGGHGAAATPRARSQRLGRSVRAAPRGPHPAVLREAVPSRDAPLHCPLARLARCQAVPRAGTEVPVRGGAVGSLVLPRDDLEPRPGGGPSAQLVSDPLDLPVEVVDGALLDVGDLCVDPQVEDHLVDVPSAALTLVADRDPVDLLQLLLGAGRERVKEGPDLLPGRSQSAAKVNALDAGVDELLARLRAVTRRAPVGDDTPYVRIGAYLVDLQAHRVTNAAATDARRPPVDLHLTPTEWQLLEQLVRNPGKAGQPAGAAAEDLGAEVRRRDPLPPPVHGPAQTQARARSRTPPPSAHRAGHGVPVPAVRGIQHGRQLHYGRIVVRHRYGREPRRESPPATDRRSGTQADIIRLLNTRSPARPRLVRTLTSSPPKISTRSWTPAES